MTNGIDAEIAKQFVGDIQRHKETLLSYRGEYMARCKNIHDLIKETKERAADAGIPRKVLNAKLKKLDLLAKIEGVTENFDEDEEVLFESLEKALGDYAETPLGAAAVDKAASRRNRKAKAAEELVG